MAIALELQYKRQQRQRDQRNVAEINAANGGGGQMHWQLFDQMLR